MERAGDLWAGDLEHAGDWLLVGVWEWAGGLLAGGLEWAGGLCAGAQSGLVACGLGLREGWWPLVWELGVG